MCTANIDALRRRLVSASAQLDALRQAGVRAEWALAHASEEEALEEEIAGLYRQLRRAKRISSSPPSAPESADGGES